MRESESFSDFVAIIIIIIISSEVSSLISVEVDIQKLSSLI